MKKNVFVLFLLLFVMNSNKMSAQHNTGLKGPAFKNYKPWKNSNPLNNSSTVLIGNRIVNSGPMAKHAEVKKTIQSSIGIQLSSIKMNSLMSKNPIAARRLKEKMDLMIRREEPIPSVVRSEF